MSDRIFGGGGGKRYSGGGSYGGGGYTLALPPFGGVVRQVILINTVIFFGLLLAGLFSPIPGFIALKYFSLIPAYVLKGAIWQIVTYSFLHTGFWHIFGNLLQLWFFGSAMETHWGSRQFLEFYLFTVIGGALCTIAVSFTGLLGVTPMIPTMGASAGVFGILIAYALYYGDNEIMLMLPPVSIKAKYLAWIMVLVNLALALGAGGPSGVAYMAHLGGALFAWVYVKFLPSRGLGFATSEGYYGVRNSYYKWKRRRAARKFEVYMRKQDRKEYFDQYGNYKAPEQNDKKNGESGPSGWVN